MSIEEERMTARAMLDYASERNIIQAKVLDAATELTGGSVLRVTMDPAMLSRWWLQVFDSLRTQDLIFTDGECDDRIEHAVAEAEMGDDL